MDERTAADLSNRISADLASGKPRYEILQTLVSEGHDRKATEALLRTEEERRQRARTGGRLPAPPQAYRQRQPGVSDMIWGGFFCVAGLLVTLLSLANASPGGGYIIAWGAIVFGAIRFFRGMSKASKGGSPGKFGPREDKPQRYDF